MRQTQIHHGKFKFIAAISHSLRQNQVHHGKFRFATANKKLTRYLHNAKSGALEVAPGGGNDTP